MNISLRQMKHICANYKTLWLYAGSFVDFRHRSDSGLQICNYRPFHETTKVNDSFFVTKHGTRINRK